MTAALKLYEWGDELARVEGLLYDAEGELTAEIEAALDAVTLGFSEKAERVALFVRELLANSKAVKEEADRLTARAKQYERAADGLKRYLQAQMERAGIPKVEGKLCTVRLQKSPPSVVSTLTDDDLRSLRDEYVTVVPESRQLNAAAVIAYWKQTEESPVDGVTVTQNLHLRIN